MTDTNETSDTVRSDSISLAAARRVLDAALAHAASISRALCITICDPFGDPVLSARMDGAPRLTAQIAADKAWTVAGFGGVPTHDWWSMIEHDPALVHGITKTPRLVVFGGGVALRVEAQVVGAIGVSGGSSADDRAVAEAGAAALAQAE